MAQKEIPVTVDVRWHIHLNRPINFIELLPDDEMYYGMEMAEWDEPISIARESICPKCLADKTHIHQYGDKIIKLAMLLINEMTKAYRYYDQMYSGCTISPSGSESYYPIGPKIELSEYQVVKLTPKGFWIITDCCYLFLGEYEKEVRKYENYKRRWIGNDHRKKFACLTKEEAMESFRARKRRQISLLRKQLDIAEKALAAASK